MTCLYGQLPELVKNALWMIGNDRKGSAIGKYNN
jgi:hypothetical protein